LRLAIMSAKAGEGEYDEDESFGSEDFDALSSLRNFDSRPAPASNMLDVDDGDIIDI
jgi:hypothetical protein